MRCLKVHESVRATSHAQEFDELDLDLDEPKDEPAEAPPTRVKGPPDFVVIRQGPDPAKQRSPPASTAQAPPPPVREVKPQSSGAQSGVTSPLPAAPPVSSSSKSPSRSAPSRPPLPAISRLARSAPVPPAQPTPNLTEQLEQARGSVLQQQQQRLGAESPSISQQQQQPPDAETPAQPVIRRTQPAPSPAASGLQNAAQQLWPRGASASPEDIGASTSVPAEPVKTRSSRHADVDFEWEPLPSIQPSPTVQPQQLSTESLSKLRDSAARLRQPQRQQQALGAQPSTPQQLSTAQQPPVGQQQRGVSKQQEQRKPWQFTQPETAGSDIDFFARQGFPEVGAARELLSGLNGMGIKSPSHIQAAAFQVHNLCICRCSCQMQSVKRGRLKFGEDCVL